MTARLLVGVGTCDEPVRLAGVTHMVEHLVIRGALPIVAPHNASTDSWTTVFETTAPTTEEALDVIVGLTRSIAGIATVSEEDVARERKVLAAEDGLAYSEQVASIHTVRFGPTGPGRSGGGAAATHSLTAAEVRDWARQWFVAENAVVTVRGGTAPDDRLAVALPSGRPAGPLPRWTGPVGGGRLCTGGLGGVAASVVVPQATALLLDAVIEHEVFDDVRIGAAVVYDVAAHTLDVDLDRAAVGVVVDPADEDVAATIELLVATLRRIADQGPSPATVARIEAARALNTLDRDFRADHDLAVGAYRRLRGVRGPGPLEVRVSAEEIAELRQDLRAALPDLVVHVDEDMDVDLDAVAGRVGLSYEAGTAGRPVSEVEPLGRPTGPTHRDAMLPAWASARIRLHGTKLVLLPRGDVGRVIDLSTVAAVGLRGTAGLTIVDAAGGLLQLRADEWWRGARLLAEVRSATPQHLVRDFRA